MAGAVFLHGTTVATAVEAGVFSRQTGGFSVGITLLLLLSREECHQHVAGPVAFSVETQQALDLSANELYFDV